MATPIHIQSQTSFAFSWRMLWRDWRGGELRILAIALIIAVTSVTAVSFFIDRVERGLNQQAAELIAADLVISSSRQINADYIQAAKQRGLKLANTTQFRSVAVAKEQPQLVEVKAVTQHYPLRGELRNADVLYGEERATRAIPARGEVWVEPRLLQALNLKVGEPLQLGARSFTITQVLVYEPDRSGDMFSVAPRVLMHADDVAATRIEASLRKGGGPLLVDLDLFDVYRGHGVDEGTRSLAYRLRFQATDRTLTDAEVADVRQACIDQVTTKTGAALRG